MQILANDLYIETTSGPGSAFTEPMALDGKNSVILEAWLVSASGLSGPNQVQVFVQASNDLEAWKDFSYTYGVTFMSGPAAWLSAPSGGGGSPESILFKYVRLNVTLIQFPASAVVRAGLSPVSLP